MHCVCVSVIRSPGEETQTINGGQMVERRREASVCVCVGEAMGEADGQGGGLATFKEKKKVLYFLF